MIGEVVAVKHRSHDFVPQQAVKVGSVINADNLDHMVDISCQHETARTVYSIRDMEIDIIVEGMGPTYRIIDRDRFGARLLAGEFTTGRCALNGGHCAASGR